MITPISARRQIKEALVSLACKNLLPATWATWLIPRIGLEHV